VVLAGAEAVAGGEEGAAAAADWKPRAQRPPILRSLASAFLRPSICLNASSSSMTNPSFWSPSFWLMVSKIASRPGFYRASASAHLKESARNVDQTR